ncbi:MAG: hypothetical protein JW797_03805, partial [Bradymonadales bacterium]|nr:hypothetical protein [Bradymonadales bacterium]
MKDQQLPGLDVSSKTEPVECLGQTFESDDSRRAHYLTLLAEKLKDPEFRKTPGFPKGTDEDILRLSDPPYYTACPNPFLGDFVRVHGKPYDPTEEYRREPFAVDVSVGKTDALYRAHSYHTKVPHLAIVPSILHYTKPGDLVLDGFCGSGMTGVAAQWCGSPPDAYRWSIEERWKAVGLGMPRWGARRAILGDLSPAATFIAANYNLPFDIEQFSQAARRLLEQVEAELGWMYQTLHVDPASSRLTQSEPAPRLLGQINYTVWSEVFTCPECNGEVNFVEEALDEETKRVHDEFPCPGCGVRLTKKKLERLYETRFDKGIGETVKAPRRKPVLINYSVGKAKYEKVPDEFDLAILQRIDRLALPPEVPINRMMNCAEGVEVWGDKWRAGTASFAHVHHLFLNRAAQALAALWRCAQAETDARLRNMLLFFVEQAIWGMSVLNRYQPIQQGRPGGSQVNRQLSGVYYVASQIAEVSPEYNLGLRLDRLKKHAFARPFTCGEAATATTGDCANIPLCDDSIDYIFTDPPFGSNFAYAELNFVVEAWHRVFTAPSNEAIVSPTQRKGVHEYQDLMRRCFVEYHRVLKPGRWMTVVFSNSSNAIWRAIQEAMGSAGFIVADVRTLDKQQGSFNQVHGVTVKQDLVISAYKSTEALAQRFALGTANIDSVWAFVGEHLRNIPIFVGTAEVIAERTPQMLHDRMIAFFVQRGVAVPVSGPDFFAGLVARYSNRDGMYFLPEQVTQYDRKRTSVRELRQLELFVSDEASATQWVRQQLDRKPQSFQELQPQFMLQLKSWAKHEKTVELKEILALNFFCYDGKGPVPSQVHSYLSSNFKDLRNLEKDDPALKAKAKDRWYVPDPSKEADLEKLRLRTLLREFEEYKLSTSRKIKVFRTEAVRAGFKHCYD